jgi:DNA-binding NarL/FixJ family response regulator
VAKVLVVDDSKMMSLLRLGVKQVLNKPIESEVVVQAARDALTVQE